jgi:hypothetical protein
MGFWLSRRASECNSRATTGELTWSVQDVIRPHETTLFTDAWGAYAGLVPSVRQSGDA